MKNEQQNENEQLRQTPVIGSASKRIGVVGIGNMETTSLAAAIALAKSKGVELSVVRSKPADVVINGVGWNEKPKAQTSGRMAGLISMLAAFQCFDNAMFGSGYTRSLPQGINIIKEYGLIELKQSKLSKWERDAVVSVFERNFQRAE